MRTPRSRILVVDDDALMLRTVERILAPAHEVSQSVVARAEAHRHLRKRFAGRTGQRKLPGLERLRPEFRPGFRGAVERGDGADTPDVVREDMPLASPLAASAA